MDTVGRSYLLPTEQPIPAAGKEVTPESVTSFVPKPQPSEGDDKLHLIKTFFLGGGAGLVFRASQNKAKNILYI